MANIFDTADDYSSEMLLYVRQTCLYVATLLNDLLADIVIVGGLVPQLLVDPKSIQEDQEAHVGTRDLDLGLSLLLLDEERYKGISERLRHAGFRPDVNDSGKTTSQRWRIEMPGLPKVTIDFLMGRADAQHVPGKLHNLEKDFSAFVAPAVPLAFRDRELIPIRGKTILGEEIARDVELPVCGPGAFVVLKALAFRSRGKFKDAYDLFWLVRNYAGGVPVIADRLRPLLDSAEANEALKILDEDFTEDNHLGPVRVALFQRGGHDDELQADVVAFVGQLLRLCRRNGP